MRKLVLVMVWLPLCATAQESYEPEFADPMLEDWRYSYFPELDDKGVRSMTSSRQSNTYWFGLDSGVVSYNGFDWHTYGNKEGLSGLPVQKVFLDKNDQIYAATSDGLFTFAKDQWKNLFQTHAEIQFNFKSIIQLASGNLVCGTTHGAVFVTPDQSYLLTTAKNWSHIKDHLPNFKFVEIPSTLLIHGQFDNISDVFEVSPGQLWIAVTYLLEDEKGDIMMFSEKEILSEQVVHYNLFSKYYHVQLGYEQKILKVSNGDIWIINKSNRLPAIRYKNHRWEEVPYGQQFGDDEYSESILETKDGKLWLSGIGNLYAMDHNGEWSKYSSQTLNIPQGHIVLHTGHETDLWVLGYQSEVYRVDLSDEKWKTYKNLNYQCTQSDGTHWFLDISGQAISNHGEVWQKYNQKHLMMNGAVSLYADSKDVVWAIGSQNEQACAGYLSNNRWNNILIDSISWGLDYRAIIEAQDGSIWVGGSTDVFLELGQTGGLVQIVNPYSGDRQLNYFRSRTLGLNQLNAYGIAQTRDSNLWIGGTGLCAFDGGQWHYTNTPDLNNYVNDVCNDINGILYVASRQHGLFINTAQGGWKNYSVQNGLISNNIISLAVKDSTEIWLGTDRGYSFFNGDFWINNTFPPSLTLSYEGGSIHLGQSSEIWISRSLREWKRRIYTGKKPNQTVQDKFMTHRFVKDSIAPETAIEIYSEEVDQSGNTTVFWSGRHYFNKTEASDLLYSYRLNKGDWSPFTPLHSHTFTGLDDDHYLFEVRAMDKEGNIDLTPASVSFVVLPPIWKQVWFVLMISSFLIAIGFYQYQIIKKRQILERLNSSLHTVNEELETKNVQIQKQKDSLEELIQQIDQLSQAKMRFFTNITHEFRTPLSLILGPIERLTSQSDAKSNEFSFYNLIKKNALRLQKLINQLLEIRRIESGTLELQLHQTDLVEFVRDTKNLFTNKAIEKEIRLGFQSDFEKLTLYFDQDKIEKILFNLLSNAMKYTSANGKINVKLLKDDGTGGVSQYVRMIVSDDGTGIDQDLQDHLFERFSVGKAPIKNELQESSGIGLSYIKDLVEFHQGKITYQSTPGKGTTFTVYIPENMRPEAARPEWGDFKLGETVDASLLAAEVPLKNSTTSTNNESKRILVVEDNEDMRFFITSLLQENYVVLQADNGQAGLDLLDREYVDLIISDIMMPELDGISFCDQVKANPTTSHLPVILLTALALDEKRISGYESGADSYIVKPFLPELLLARVNNLLEFRDEMKQRFAADLRFKPKEIQVTSVDEAFLENIASLMETHVSDAQFDIGKMCNMIGMSHMHFIRKVKQLTDKKPMELLKSFRLTRAKQLLEQNKINVSEVGYMVGYDLPNSFTRAFKNEFGVTPTQFAEQSKS
ncbi:response regulator [Reichenbachiella carrageenanivorans]|uniref:histidine kinase n=1 Tax=Reichenbachiella carrageenanivorans TaxID=2979869 RepID=A0ABY6CUL8_9BACT|nr:ATP-binding protein [Reichenbachiella carrageenanivorans]UXX77611.1 response regulator [Reichenbachiella carrageenanivorans]